MIDTSTTESFVSLFVGGELFTEFLPPMKQSQTLLPAIQKLLENETIDFIAVGTGPGSFTGIRVGVMTAKTLAFAKGLSLVPFCSLKIYTPEEEGPFALYGDGKSEKTFVLEGEKVGEKVTFGSPYIKEGKKPLSKTLNLPFLGRYLQEKYSLFGGDSHGKIEVCYLKNP